MDAVHADQQSNEAQPVNGEPRLPDFLIIGAQKSGTTWLWKMFRDHPEVRIPPRKEIHFFDRQMLTKSIAWYMNELADPHRTASVAGEKTPCYSHLKPQSIRFIRHVVPEVKIILLLREPVDRAWSQARMEVSNYNKKDLSDRDITRCVFQSGLLRNSRRTNYRRITENWLSVFPPEQVFIGFYDDVHSQPHALLNRICRFLGVSESAETESVGKRVWQSPAVKMPAAVHWYLRRRYRRTAEWVADNFEDAPDWTRAPADPDEPCGWMAKLKVLLTAYVATLPYNALYLLYDWRRDMRIRKRIQELQQAE